MRKKNKADKVDKVDKADKTLQGAKDAVPTEQAPISKDDIEAKFRTIKTDVDQVTTDKKNQIIPAVGLGAILIMLIAYLLGTRTGKKKSAVVQIRRI